MNETALSRLEEYVRRKEFAGWDPFDGLNSRVFKASPLYKLPTARLAWIQFFKRSPLNIRKYLLVPQGQNPKGLALFASGMLLGGKTDDARELLELLKSLRCNVFSANSWGYNFDWQARAFYVPAGTPNMVATVFAANAFLDYYDATGESEALATALSTCRFILDHLAMVEEEETLCFAYIPGEKAMVHNANMLGAALLARVYFHTGNTEFLEKSRKAMNYSVEALNPDGSWGYGELPHHRFIDNFHTGYNLVALNSWIRFTGETRWVQEVDRAYDYYLGTFWLEDGCPRYYHNSLYPIDVHCSAQGIVTCLELAKYDRRSVPLVRKIAEWSVRHMQDESGYFHYQKTRSFTNRIPYMRWSQAWMFYALSRLRFYEEKPD